MTRPIEVSLLGGWTERRMRRHRDVEDLPWGTVRVADHDPQAIARARAMWTNGIFTEYASAVAFSQLATAFAECGAPIDLTAACADIVVDEMAHVELVSRTVLELGGAVPFDADLDRITQLPDPDARPLMRAAELAVTTSCVGESLSVPALRASREVAGGLIHEVLDRLVRDEGPHAQLGVEFLAWAADDLDDADRARLADIALGAVAVYAPLWRGQGASDGAPALGATPDAAYRDLMSAAVRDKIDARLVRHGIVMDRGRLAALLE